ncbi:MAG: HAMP domain-containing histidine kinase [Ignavibacteria bacterium]|jgi:signal transduction histidine kinase|nr:HAMP domain-containing histidine kinase [Ignavibacteria bacterium]
MKRFIILISILSSIFSTIIYADATYPYTIQIKHIYDGRYLSDTKDTNGYSYFINSNWIGDDATIHFRKGINNSISKSVSVPNTHIISATHHNNGLQLVRKDGNSIYSSYFDTILHSNNTPIASVNVNRYDAHWINSKNKLLLLLDNNLYDSTELIASNVIDCQAFNNRDDYSYAYIVDKRDYGIVQFIAHSDTSHFVARIPLTQSTKLIPLRNYIIAANATNTQDVLISIMDINSKNLLGAEWIKANANFIVPNTNSNDIYTLTNEKANYHLHKFSITNLANNNSFNATLPDGLYNPIKLVSDSNHIYALFTNALVVYDMKLRPVLFDYYDFSNFNFANPTDNITITAFSNYILIASAQQSLIFSIHYNKLWFITKQIDNTYRYAIPILLFILGFIFYRKYRNQKRLFEAIIDLPSSGFVFFINRVGKLIKLNEGGKRILNYADDIPLKKQFAFYCSTEHTYPIAALVERGLVDRITFQQKINIVENNLPFEWLCSLIPLRNIYGRFSGIILTGIDITEELERQMLTNWAQLAHDMQTNLSTIRLNVEQINTNSDEDVERKKKILHQVSILVHRVRDIVTVGRNDKLEKTLVNSIDLCNEIRSEFDDNLFAKVQFKMELTDFNFICDKPKLMRAVRNAVENSIKYMKDTGGYITIACFRDIHNISVVIRDNGIGMNEDTKHKIYTPFFSTTRKDGGYGIGTMIMQRVAEIHGGKLLIESKVGVGTEITFLIPDLSRHK